MSVALVCPQCGASLSAKSPQGHCPACLLKAGLESCSASETPASAAKPCGFDPAMAMTIEHVRGPVTAAPLPERTLPEPGDRFGGYQIVRTLGKGGMGAVFEADQLETGRRVALKVLKHSLDSPEARKRFLREGRLAASINHPNSVYVFGTEEVQGTPAIAMELVAGGTLQELVKKSGPLPVGVLRAVQNGGGGRESGRLKLAAHIGASLRSEKMGASAPILPNFAGRPRSAIRHGVLERSSSAGADE